MNFVGREASATVQPRACMCNNQGTFVTGKSNNDTCAFCGCICGIILSNGNFTTASTTNRMS